MHLLSVGNTDSRRGAYIPVSHRRWHQSCVEYDRCHTENAQTSDVSRFVCVATVPKLHARKCRFDMFINTSTLFNFDVPMTCRKTSEWPRCWFDRLGWSMRIQTDRFAIHRVNKLKSDVSLKPKFYRVAYFFSATEQSFQRGDNWKKCSGRWHLFLFILEHTLLIFYMYLQ